MVQAWKIRNKNVTLASSVIILEFLVSSRRQGKERKGITQTWKEEEKVTLVTAEKILYIENPNESPNIIAANKWAQQTLNEFNEWAQDVKNNIQEIICISL